MVSRSRCFKYASRGEVDTEGRWSVFGQIYRRLSSVPVNALRRTEQLWDTVFAGERAHDAGGPYRECWSALCADLMSPHLPLLLPCPNNVGKVGVNQETFLVNPDCARSPVQMDMLVCLGKLMGIAARAKNFLDLYLAPMVWKMLVQQPVSLEDLRAMDVTGANQLQSYRARRGMSEATWSSDYSDLFFATTTRSSIGATLLCLSPRRCAAFFN